MYLRTPGVPDHELALARQRRSRPEVAGKKAEHVQCVAEGESEEDLRRVGRTRTGQGKPEPDHTRRSGAAATMVEEPLDT